jgi:hypothetical protein
MKHTFRLSRVRAPRGTLGASMLLALVFIVFGLVASAFGLADTAHAPQYVNGSTQPLSQWLFGQL